MLNRFFTLLLTLPFFLGFCYIYGKETLPEVICRALTKEEEFDRIKVTISELPWLKKNGYFRYVTLPQHKNFEAFYLVAEKFTCPSSDIVQSGSTTIPHFSNEEHFQKIFFSEIYDSNSYSQGLKESSSSKETIEKALRKLILLKKNWGFNLMPKCQVLLTLYGVGGNYDCDTNWIFIKTTPKGISSYNSPSTSIIHEMVHIGIEKNIVQKFKLTWMEKEHLVDMICSIYLKEFLPKYTFQTEVLKFPPPAGMCDFVHEESIVHNLPLAISNFVTRYPR
jgi:hypothetical protein